MQTTLELIRQHSPCQKGWVKLLKHLNKTKADNDPLPLLTVLDSNGFDDALWCMRAVDGYDKEKRLYAVWCARKARHIMTDQRSIYALDVAEKFAKGEATKEELNAVSAAVWNAAVSAAVSGDVWNAARNAAKAAAWNSVSAAACAAAWNAARDGQEKELQRILSK